MNNYKIEVKQYSNAIVAEERVNEFIEICNKNGKSIVDITSHVTEIENFMTYIFIFKVKGGTQSHQGI